MAGSPHDFSQAAWNVNHNPCLPCHQQQHADLSAHAPVTSTVYKPYDSPSFNAGPQSPSGPSLVCLSCHDGTLAVNQFIQTTNGNQDLVFVGNAFQVGPDLHTMHPISFTYDEMLAMQDGGLEDPTTYRIGDPKQALTLQTAPVPPIWSGTSLLNKTIDEALLVEHKVECISCHDVHRLDGSSTTSNHLLRIAGTDSSGRADLLCRTCHVK